MDLFPGKIEFREGWKAEDFSFYPLAGTATIREDLLVGVEPEDIEIGWAKDSRAFQAKRKKYLLYS